MLLALKRLICWLGFGDRLVEFCDCCGRRPMFVWWAPPALWNEIVGPYEALRCERCFDREARAKGISLRWVPRAEHRCVDGEWSEVAPPDPELFPVAARLRAESQLRGNT